MMPGLESSVDDLAMERSAVSGRVTLLSRSAEALLLFPVISCDDEKKKNI